MMAALDESTVLELADTLWRAELSREATRPITEMYPQLSASDAYRVQSANIERRLSAGERVIGRKIGLTSRAMQQQLGVDEPDYGVITDRMVIPPGGVLFLDELIAPKLEPEFAFRIDRTLTQFPTLDEVHGAVGAVALSIEVIDSRVENWRIALADTIADNASSARIVRGAWVEASADVLAALPHSSIALTRNQTMEARGQGSAVLGNPLTSVHWLAQVLGKLGTTLRAGDIVLAGSVCAAVTLSADDDHTAWSASAPGFADAELTVRATRRPTVAEGVKA